MATKGFTLIIEVDLACNTCCTKIQKVLCKIKAKENIENISSDTMKNEISITGSFNPHRLYHKLRCKAGCMIKGYRIIDNEAEEKKKKEAAAKKKKDEEEAAAKKKKQEEEAAAKKKKQEEEEKKRREEEAKRNPTLTVQVCLICYPLPCSDPVDHRPQPRQWPPPPNWNTCAGPPRCGGCGSCGGGAWWQPPAVPLPGNCCPGPAKCRGCMGCRVVHEQKFEYHEYPPSACVLM